MKNEKRVCAVCGDDCQNNVLMKWQRDSDRKVFNICMLCAEMGKVNAQSVDNIKRKGTETTIETPRKASVSTKESHIQATRKAITTRRSFV